MSTNLPAVVTRFQDTARAKLVEGGRQFFRPGTEHLFENMARIMKVDLSAAPGDFQSQSEELAQYIASNTTVHNGLPQASGDIVKSAEALFDGLFGKYGGTPNVTLTEPFRSNLNKSLMLLLGQMDGYPLPCGEQHFAPVVDAVKYHHKMLGMKKEEIQTVIQAAIQRHQGRRQGITHRPFGGREIVESGGKNFSIEAYQAWQASSSTFNSAEYSIEQLRGLAQAL